MAYSNLLVDGVVISDLKKSVEELKKPLAVGDENAMVAYMENMSAITTATLGDMDDKESVNYLPKVDNKAAVKAPKKKQGNDE
jgi:hypothetical protein